MLASSHSQFRQHLRRQDHPEEKARTARQGKGTHLANQLVYEIRIHQQLSHQNVVHLDHWFEDENFQYIFMEYCSEGVSLSRFRIWRSGCRPRVSWARRKFVTLRERLFKRSSTSTPSIYCTASKQSNMQPQIVQLLYRRQRPYQTRRFWIRLPTVTPQWIKAGNLWNPQLYRARSYQRFRIFVLIRCVGSRCHFVSIEIQMLSLRGQVSEGNSGKGKNMSIYVPQRDQDKLVAEGPHPKDIRHQLRW